MTTFIDLSSLGDRGFSITGGSRNSGIGLSVASAGDVNNDGLLYLMIGANFGNKMQGFTYVLFGKADGLGPINLAQLSPADGIVIQGGAKGDHSGYGSSIGDMNGDGVDDMVVGAFGSDDGGKDAGAAYVIYGGTSGLADLNLGKLSAVEGFEIVGAESRDFAGNAVSSARDINGDGFADLIVGAWGSGGTGAGKAYVIFGTEGGYRQIDLAHLAPADGFVIQGETTPAELGMSVASAWSGLITPPSGTRPQSE